MKLGPNALFTLLEEGLDTLIERFRDAAPNEPTTGEFVLDKAAVHKLTARLISVTSKLNALERFCGMSLRSIAVARAALGDPITDEEIAAHTVKAGAFPGIVSESSARPTPEPRPTRGPDGKLLN